MEETAAAARLIPLSSLSSTRGTARLGVPAYNVSSSAVNRTESAAVPAKNAVRTGIALPNTAMLQYPWVHPQVSFQAIGLAYFSHRSISLSGRRSLHPYSTPRRTPPASSPPAPRSQTTMTPASSPMTNSAMHLYSRNSPANSAQETLQTHRLHSRRDCTGAFQSQSLRYCQACTKSPP